MKTKDLGNELEALNVSQKGSVQLVVKKSVRNLSADYETEDLNKLGKPNYDYSTWKH